MTIENRASFFARLEDLDPATKRKVNQAYELAKDLHRWQIRDTGERYFEHLRGVALTLIDSCGITDPEMIIAALLHDSVEDTEYFAPFNMPFSERKKLALERMGGMFGMNTTNMVLGVTKPNVDGVEIIDKAMAREIFHQSLFEEPPKVKLLKGCDRCHNVSTLEGTSPEKIARICDETEQVYFELLHTARPTYPAQVDLLVDKMTTMIRDLRTAQTRIAS